MEVVQQGWGTSMFRGCVSERHKPLALQGCCARFSPEAAWGASRPRDVAVYSPLWRPRWQQSSPRAELQVTHQSSTLYRKIRGRGLESPWTRSHSSGGWKSNQGQGASMVGFGEDLLLSSWCAAVHGVTKNWTQLSDWTELFLGWRLQKKS